MVSKKYIEEIKHGGFRSFIRRAIRCGVKVRIIFEQPRVLVLSYKQKSIVCVGDCIPVFKRSSDTATRNKAVTKAALASIGISTPRGILATTYTELKRKMVGVRLKYPLIAKPLDQGFAQGVTWNIQSEAELRKAVAYIRETSLKPAGQQQSFLVEEMAAGEEYRVLIFKRTILSCVKKLPAIVTGDGHSSIRELVDSFNKKRSRGFELKIDAVVKESLRSAGLTLQSILPNGYAQKLRNNLNMSDGGRSIECTHLLSERLRKICILALDVLGMNYGGIDIITPSLTSPLAPYVILEVNPLPYYNMHEKPLVEGVGVDVSGILLKELFPSLKIDQ